jgi:hypothetical protein
MKATLCRALVLASLITPVVHASPLGDERLSISGFGTLGLARINTDEAQFVRYNQVEGVKRRPGVGTDSNLGLQATYLLTPDLSATAQIITHKTTMPAFTSELTWAFLKLKLNDDFNVRVGRIVPNTFMISDVQEVGFANNMIRPPIEMYGQVPMKIADGADVNYQQVFGDATLSAQLIAGVSTGKMAVGGSVLNFRSPLWGVNAGVEYGPFTMRGAYLHTRFENNDFAGLNNVLRGVVGAGFPQLAADLTTVNGKVISFRSVGMTMDWNDIVVQAEYGQRRAGEPVYIADNNAGYFQIGYRIGKVLPYYARAKLSQAGRSVTLPASFSANRLFQTVNTGFLTTSNQHTDILGARWDFAKGLDLKVQIDRIQPEKKSGLLIFGPAVMTKPVTAIAVAVDFVF